jgi:hypothetical protein
MRRIFPERAPLCHRAAMRTVIVVTLLGLCAVNASAQGFPAFDAVAERVIIGKLPVPDAQRTDGIDPIARGAFNATQSGLSMTAPAAYGESTWIARGVPLSSGIVRARFVAGARLDSAVLLRASTTEDGELVRALGVSVERNKTLRIVRYENRSARPLGSEDKLEAPLVTGMEVELVIVVSGPLIMADLYDGATLRLLAHVAAHDSGIQQGFVGLRVSKAQDKDSKLVFLASSSQPGPTGMRTDDGAYDQRTVTVPRGAVLPKDLATRVVEERPDALVLHVDPTDTERLRRLGLA